MVMQGGCMSLSHVLERAALPFTMHRSFVIGHLKKAVHFLDMQPEHLKWTCHSST